MSENETNVVGYFNPHKYPIFIEISEINLKAELAPNAFIRDRTGRCINDPIFERFCHKTGLSRSVSKTPVPMVAVPRFVRPQRQPVAVSQATGFVRDGGRTVPTFAPAPTTQQREVALNKTPITGMTMEAARQLGYVGKPRLVSEDYGVDETSGVPPKGALPDIKVSIESPPRLKAAQATRPQTVQDLTAALSAPKEPLPEAQAPVSAPVPLKAPSAPAPVTAIPVAPISPKTRTRVSRAKPTPVQNRRVATPVAAEPAPAPVQPAPPTPVKVEPIELTPETAVETAAEPPVVMSGVVQPLDEGEFPPPNLETPPSDVETGNRFICAADGRSFPHRSELLRHVKTNYEDMEETLMAPYPGDAAETA